MSRDQVSLASCRKTGKIVLFLVNVLLASRAASRSCLMSLASPQVIMSLPSLPPPRTDKMTKSASLKATPTPAPMNESGISAYFSPTCAHRALIRSSWPLASAMSSSIGVLPKR